MKKFLNVCSAVIILTLTFGAGAYAANAGPKVFVNSNQVQTAAEPKIINGSVYVPLRAVADGLDMNIQWDNKSKSVYVDSDPNFKTETSSVEFASERDLAFEWIMAYDNRQHQNITKLVSANFETDIYNESVPIGNFNMNSIVDMRVVARSTNHLTVRIVQRVTAEDDYKVKVEKWKFTFDNAKIQSVKIVPHSTQWLDRYTVVPGVNFGE